MSIAQSYFGSAVSKLRMSLNLSQGEVARRSKRGGMKGISDGYLSQIESGHILPESLSVKKLMALSRGMKVPVTLLAALACGVKQTDPEVIVHIHEYLKALPEDRQNDVLLIVKAFFGEIQDDGKAKLIVEVQKENFCRSATDEEIQKEKLRSAEEKAERSKKK
jgi:transcriptional regulator with XRE-family HTH domain